jgi:hypothetical protein
MAVDPSKKRVRGTGRLFYQWPHIKSYHCWQQGHMSKTTALNCGAMRPSRSEAWVFCQGLQKGVVWLACLSGFQAGITILCLFLLNSLWDSNMPMATGGCVPFWSVSV